MWYKWRNACALLSPSESAVFSLKQHSLGRIRLRAVTKIVKLENIVSEENWKQIGFAYLQEVWEVTEWQSTNM